MTEQMQTLVLEDRKELSISAVKDVSGFSEERIQLDSAFGAIDILGQGLKIAAFNLENGTIQITGRVDSIAYQKSRDTRSVRTKGRDMMARILK